MLCPFCWKKDTSVVDSGPTEDGAFVPSIGSAKWPLNSDENIDVYEENIVDLETFEKMHRGEIIYKYEDTSE